MPTMDALSIRYNSSHSTDRVLACAGDSHASSGIDVACPTTQSVLAIASPHELHEDSWPSSSTSTSSFCCNQQYSVTAITTSTGTIAERYAYTAYGQPTILEASASVLGSSAINNRYTYTGRDWDATLGLYHFRARWVSPSVGRLLTTDPIGYAVSKWNLTEYVSSSPLLLFDPSGYRSVSSIDVDDEPCRRRPGSRGHGAECRRCANLLRNWIDRENARTGPSLQEILSSLPACPCRSKCPIMCWYKKDARGNPIYAQIGEHDCVPKGWSWDLGVSYPILPIIGYQVYSLHPGADVCMRSNGGSTTSPEQQCCYDTSGNLVTSGTGAGSPDINDPDHFSGEVHPYLCALYLDDSEVGGRHIGRP